MQWVREKIVGTMVREVRVTRLYGVRLRTLSFTEGERKSLEHWIRGRHDPTYIIKGPL